MEMNLSARIFEELRTAIINGVYPIGIKLPTERELAEQYNSSRFAVREAIAMLSQQAFVETHPKSGTYVKDFYTDGSLDTLVQTLRVRRAIDRQTFVSLLKFRTIIETNSAAEAALRINSKDIGALEANLTRKSENLGDIAVLTECDYDFHYIIIHASGNIINKLVFQSFKPIYSFFTSFFYSLPDAARTSLNLNRQLLAALRAADAQDAAAAMERILKSGEEIVFGAFDERDGLIVLPRE